MKNGAIVHVIDEDLDTGKSIQLLMESVSIVVRIYESGEEFIDTVDPKRPGCVILDLKAPSMRGIEVLQRLQAAHNEIPVIIISGYVDIPAANDCIRPSTIDFVQKPIEPRALLDAVYGAIAKSIEELRRMDERECARQRLGKLTPRELDMLKRVVAGMPNKRIATDLNISIKTVANHRANLMAKTQALNAADLARISTIAALLPANRPAPNA